MNGTKEAEEWPGVGEGENVQGACTEECGKRGYFLGR